MVMITTFLTDKYVSFYIAANNYARFKINFKFKFYI